MKSLLVNRFHSIYRFYTICIQVIYTVLIAILTTAIFKINRLLKSFENNRFHSIYRFVKHNLVDIKPILSIINK